MYAIRYGETLIVDSSWTCLADVIYSFHGGFAEDFRVTGTILQRQDEDAEWVPA
jgi:hypothetical protein